jgi:hypothetical protein
MEDWVIRHLGHDGLQHYYRSNSTGVIEWTTCVEDARSFDKTRAVRIAQICANEDFDVEIIPRPQSFVKKTNN